MKLLLSIACSLFLLADVYSQTPDDTGILISSVVNDDTLSLYLQLNSDNEKQRLLGYAFGFYDNTKHTQQLDYIDSTYLGVEKGNYFFLFTFPLASLPISIEIRLNNFDNGLVFSKTHEIFNSHPFLLKDARGLPVLNSWVNAGQYQLPANPIFMYYYDVEFNVALPPMTTTSDVPSEKMQVDSLSVVSGNIRLLDPGLYLFQEDTLTNKAVCIRVTDPYFPRFTTIASLVQPLIYIVDEQERAQLATIEGDKKRFDRFWLDLTKSQDRARKIIRYYYDRVEFANRNYTTYKPGWKTDMGMIYIIFGEPSEKEINGNKQVWIYKDARNLPATRFHFIRTSSIFAFNHYVLVRERKHREIWYEKVNLIRNGIFK